MYKAMTEPERVNHILDRHEKMIQEKQTWMYTYQLVGKYVMTRKQNFMSTPTPGSLLNGSLFDNTAPTANHLMSAALIGALYPNGGKSFRIKPPKNMSKQVAGRQDIKEYFEKITQRVIDVMDNPKGGFITSLEECMLDQGGFGTAGIGAFENRNDFDRETPVHFRAVDCQKICIDEGPDGFVDTVYIQYEYTVKQLIQEFGLESLHESIIKPVLTDTNCDYNRKIRVLHAIEPRLEKVAGAFGNRDMPIASIFIDIDNRHVILENGYEEMPIFVVRFWKTMGEKYGRSPSTEGMSDIREANALREMAIIATEKMLRPPLIVNDDSVLGNGTVKANAGGLNVRRASGRLNDSNRPAIEPMFMIGEMNSTFKRITELREIIFNNYFIDRLLDLNNESRMTLGEANIRNELRGQSLGPIYARQIGELFNRIIERVFNILWRRGMLGVPPNSREALLAQLLGYEILIIPPEVMALAEADENAYEIEFISPAARIMRSEELRGIQLTMDGVTMWSPLAPDMVDNIDFDEIAKALPELTGAPSRIIRSPEEVAKIREARGKAQAQMQQLEMQKVAAETAKAGAQAAQFASKAGLGQAA